MRRSSSSGATRRFASLALVAFLAIATVVPAATAAAGGGHGPVADVDATADATAGTATALQADPANDTTGWENGVWHNETIQVNQTDGLSDAEMNAFVARSMARVEFIRGKEFNSTVPVEVISRADYRNRTARSAGNQTVHNRWNDQVWEATFIIGEDTGSAEALSETQGSSVAGFYSPRDDQIKIITDSPDSPTVSNATLIHELVHALQDQQYDLTDARYRAQTQDGDLAISGVVEGEANYIQARYAARCGQEWQCVQTPGSGGGGGGQPNLGVLLTIFNPYSDGPVYVNQVIERGGWDAFDRQFRNPPNSSEQVIHVSDEQPEPIAFEDTAQSGWERFPRQGQNGSDTVGEATIFSMFWYQASQYGAETVDQRSLFDTTSQYDAYNYSAAPSAGWANDRVFPYRNGQGENASYGYVWTTVWDTERDATEFHDTYLRMLEAHDVRETAEGYYVVPEGPFADAFLVVQDGRRVVIVNGPTVDAVQDIRPGLSPETATPTSTPTATPATDADTGDPATETSPDELPESSTETTGAGFGFLVAVVAVGLAGLLARRS